MKLIESEGNVYKFTYRAFECILNRHNTILHWCGYIEIPIDCEIDSDEISVHGGVTFDEKVNDMRRIGFDCGHSGDLSPYIISSGFSFSFNGVYRDKEYVIDEIKSMGDQLSDMPEVVKSMRNYNLNKILKE